MSQHGAPALLKRTRRQGLFVLGGLILALLWTSSIGAQDPPILRFGGRVTYVSPQEMLVALDTGRVVMLDLARIPQGEIRQIAQSDYVMVIGFIRRPSHRIIATSIQRVSPWVPTTPFVGAIISLEASAAGTLSSAPSRSTPPGSPLPQEWRPRPTQANSAPPVNTVNLRQNRLGASVALNDVSSRTSTRPPRGGLPCCGRLP